MMSALRAFLGQYHRDTSFFISFSARRNDSRWLREKSA